MHACRLHLVAAALATVLCACPTPPVDTADTGATPQGDTGIPQSDAGVSPQGDGGPQPHGDTGVQPQGDGGTQPGDLTLSDGPAYDFGRIAVGASDEHAFTLSNMGAAEATAMTIGALAAPYDLGSGSTCVTSLPSGASCQIVVRFAPTAAGDAFPAELSVSYGDAAARKTAKVSLTGSAALPAKLAFSEASFDFGDKSLGTVVDHTFTLANSGGLAATELTAASLAAPFSFKGGTYPGTGGTCGATLDAAASCTVVVAFTAPVFGNHTGTLSIGFKSGLGASKAEAALTAKSHSPAVLALSDDPSFDFGNVVVGAVAEHVFEVTNAGGADAKLVSGAAFTAPFGYQGGTFPGTGGDCGATLAPTATCKVVVTFTPTSRTGSSADLKINYDDGAASQTAVRHLIGTGSTVAIVAFSGFDYGQVNVGSTADHTFTVTNSGEAPASGLTAAPLGAGFSFKDGAYPGTGGTCGASLPAGACTLVITFAPTRAGTASTALELSFSDGLAPASVSRTLTGLGFVPATLAFGANPYDFGTIAPNGTAAVLVMLANTGSVAATNLAFDPLQVPFTYKGGAFPGLAGTCGTRLDAGASCILDLVYKPTAAGSSTSPLQATYENGSGTTATASTVLTGAAVGTAWLEITDFPPEYYSNYGLPPDPATFTFMELGVGLTVDHTFSVTNTGAADGTYAAANTLAAPFSFKGGTYPGVGGTCDTSFPKGSTCTVVVSFAPTAVGTSTGTLSIGFGAATATRALSGTATDQAQLVLFDYDIGVSFGPAFDFGIVGVGVPAEHTFFLANAGARAATAISALTLPAPFAFTGGAFPGTGGTCGTSLDPYTGCQLSVTFQPAAAGPFASTLDLSYDRGGATAHVTRDLAGTGTTAARLQVGGQGPTLDFGPVAVNGRTERGIDLINVGGATATALAARTLAAPFQFKDGAFPGTGGTCGTSLLSNASCRMVVVFEPTAAGPFGAALAFDYDDGIGGHPAAQVALQGTGVSTALLVILDWQGGGGDFNGGAFDFGVQGQPAEHTFFVYNAGAQTATTVSGSLASPFSFAGGSFPGTGGNCGTSLAAASGCSVVVTFTPATDGPVGGALRIGYHDGAATQTAVRALAGTSTTGANLQIKMCEDCGDGGVIDLGVVGQETHGLLTVHNNGAKAAASLQPSGTLENGFSYFGGSYPGTGGTCGQDLAAGASCTLGVQFTPQGTGPRSATLRLAYQDGNGGSKTASRDFYAYAVETALLTIIDWPNEDALKNPTPSFDFGLVGMPVEHTFYVLNPGAVAATSLAPGALGDGFALKTAGLPSDACGTTLAPGGVCSVTVVYTPGIDGMHRATLTLGYQNGSGAATATRPLVATATTLALLELHNCASCNANDSSMSFGIVGQPSERTMYVYNRGGGTATSLAVGALGNGFSRKTANLPADDCGATLDQGQRCSLTLVFTPNGNGERRSTLTVSYNNGAAVGSVSRELTATSTDRAMLLVYDCSGPQCGWFDSSRPFDFGTSGLPVDHEFTVVNLGARPATSLSGGLPNGYTFKGGTFPGAGGSCTTDLANGSSCTVVVTFTPPANTDATLAGDLVLSFNDGVGQSQAARALTATATSLALLRINDSFNCPTCGSDRFDTGPVGQPVEHTFYVYNLGGRDATSMGSAALATGFSFKGGQYPGAGGTCGQTLAKGASCSMVLAFSPSGLPAGLHTTALTISYQNGATTTSASVTVNVTTTDLALLRIADWGGCPTCGGSNDQPFDFGTSALNRTTEHTFHVTNLGAQAATGISAETLLSPFAFKGGQYPGTGGDCGTVLAAGASCAIVVTFTAGGTGRFESHLRVHYADGSADRQAADRWIAGSGTSQAVIQLSTCTNCGTTNFLEFGTTGVTVEKTLLLFNVGASNASSLGVGLGQGFAFKGGWPGTGGTCGATLAAGATCSLVITFDPAPLADGEYRQQTSLSYFDGQQAQQAELTLHGVATHAALLKLGDWSGCADCGSGSDSFDFGTTGSAQQHEFWLFNVGGATATGVGAGSPVLGDGFSFQGGSWPGTSGTCGNTLAIGASCSIAVTFNPVGLPNGVHTSSLNVQYGASTVSRGLKATSTDEAFLAITDCDTCGATDSPREYGTWGVPGGRTLYLRNLGAAAATNLRQGTPGLGDGFAFMDGFPPLMGGGCGTSLAAGASCTFAVSFIPAGLLDGFHQSTIAIAYDGGAAAGTTATRTVTATKTSRGFLVLSERGWDACTDNCGSWWFGDLTAGATVTQTIELSNTGGAAATNIAEPSPYVPWVPWDWAGHTGLPGQGGTCTPSRLSSMSPGDTCTLAVGFWGTTPGSYSARLRLEYDDGSGTRQPVGRNLGAAVH
ncbi:MAG: choice-of-anchor D domain-containing protein [Myxococcales bacterium]